MKKTLALVMSMLIILSVLASCAQAEKSGSDTTNSETQPSSTLVIRNGPIEPDDAPELPTENEVYPTNTPDASIENKDSDPACLPPSTKIHDMSSDSLVADYLAGTWGVGEPLYSEDLRTSVAIYADGSLSYTYDGHINYYNDTAVKFVHQMTESPKGQSMMTPLPKDWQGEKVYVDLPDQKLPENAWASSATFDQGTFVQDQQSVTQYLRGKVIDHWEIAVEEKSLLAVDYNGENYLMADDQLLRLVPGGTTEKVYDHVVDAKQYASTLYVLTLKDGVLSQFRPFYNDRWEGIKIAQNVAEARYGANSTIFVDCDGKAYLAFSSYSYRQVDSVACFGQRTLDELEELWNSFTDYDVMTKTEDFVKRYATEVTLRIIGNDNDCSIDEHYNDDGSESGNNDGKNVSF